MMDFLFTDERRAWFWGKVNKAGPDECWTWRRVPRRNVPRNPKKRRDGYIRVPIFAPDGKRFNMYAHRVSYMLDIGPLIPGLEIDHLCNNPSCVNPKHLEQVTSRENKLRAAARRKMKMYKRPQKPQPKVMNCVRCGENKPFNTDHFHVSSARRWGLTTTCKACVVASHKATRRALGALPPQVRIAVIKQEAAERHADPMKQCGRCGEIKPRATDFGIDRNSRDGNCSYCRACKVKATADSKKRNPERAKAEGRRHAQKSEVKARRQAQRSKKPSSVTM